MRQSRLNNNVSKSSLPNAGFTSGSLDYSEPGQPYDSQAMVVEADHLHNLSDLLEDFSPERLEDYLTCVKTSYVNQTKLSYQTYLINWERLDDWLLRNSGD